MFSGIDPFCNKVYPETWMLDLVNWKWIMVSWRGGGEVCSNTIYQFSQLLEAFLLNWNMTKTGLVSFVGGNFFRCQRKMKIRLHLDLVNWDQLSFFCALSFHVPPPIFCMTSPPDCAVTVVTAEKSALAQFEADCQNQKVSRNHEKWEGACMTYDSFYFTFFA